MKIRSFVQTSEGKSQTIMKNDDIGVRGTLIRGENSPCKSSLKR